MEKEKMKLWKKMLLVFFALLLLVVFILARKFVILLWLENASKDLAESTNYSVERRQLDNSFSLSHFFYKDGTTLFTMETLLEEPEKTRKITMYHTDEENITILQSDENKVALQNSSLISMTLPIYPGSNLGFGATLQTAIFSTITTEKCRDKDCFVIELSSHFKLWVEKATGLIIREMSDSSIIDYNYEFNTVTDSDIAKPDLTDCVIQENP